MRDVQKFVANSIIDKVDDTRVWRYDIDLNMKIEDVERLEKALRGLFPEGVSVGVYRIFSKVRVRIDAQMDAIHSLATPLDDAVIREYIRYAILAVFE